MKIAQLLNPLLPPPAGAEFQTAAPLQGRQQRLQAKPPSLPPSPRNPTGSALHDMSRQSLVLPLSPRPRHVASQAQTPGVAVSIRKPEHHHNRRALSGGLVPPSMRSASSDLVPNQSVNGGMAASQAAAHVGSGPADPSSSSMPIATAETLLLLAQQPHPQAPVSAGDAHAVSPSPLVVAAAPPELPSIIIAVEPRDIQQPAEDSISQVNVATSTSMAIHILEDRIENFHEPRLKTKELELEAKESDAQATRLDIVSARHAIRGFRYELKYEIRRLNFYKSRQKVIDNYLAENLDEHPHLKKAQEVYEQDKLKLFEIQNNPDHTERAASQVKELEDKLLTAELGIDAYIHTIEKVDLVKAFEAEELEYKSIRYFRHNLADRFDEGDEGALI
jgi:hypothetical protein